MERDWEGVEFHIVEYKDTGTYVMGGADEVQALLDDQVCVGVCVCVCRCVWV